MQAKSTIRMEKFLKRHSLVRLFKMKAIRGQRAFFQRNARELDTANYARKTYLEQREKLGVILSGRRTHHYTIVHILNSMNLPEFVRRKVEEASTDWFLAIEAGVAPMPMADCRKLLENFIEAARTLAADDISTRRNFLMDEKLAKIALDNLKDFKKPKIMLRAQDADKMRYVFDQMRERELPPGSINYCAEKRKNALGL